MNRVVEAAGLKRFSAFAKGTELVSVEQQAGKLRILPHRNGGSGEGYVGLEEQSVHLPDESAELAVAIEAAFSRCT